MAKYVDHSRWEDLLGGLIALVILGGGVLGFIMWIILKVTS